MRNLKKRSILILLAVLMLGSLMMMGCNKDEQGAVDPGDKPEQEGTGGMTLAGFKKTVDLNKVVATYKGFELTYGELLDQLEVEDMLQPGLGDYAVQNKDVIFEDYAAQLVIRKALYQQGIDAGIQVNEDAIDEELGFMQMMNPDWTEADMARVKEVFVYYETITESLSQAVSDADAQAFYDNNPAEFTSASVRHILFTFDNWSEEEALDKAQDITNRIRAGEDMAELAGEYSEDPGSKDAGGLYEDYPVMQWVPEFKQACLDYEIGVVGDPVKTDYGYHVIRVEDRHVTEFAELKEMIKAGLAGDDFKSYIDAEKANASVSF